MQIGEIAQLLQKFFFEFLQEFLNFVFIGGGNLATWC